MSQAWYEKAVFYHIYPLGFCGAPEKNDFTSPPEPRLKKIIQWIPHMKHLGITALYLGPVFESASHGYDTSDYFTVDRRLGTAETLREVISKLHENDIRVILDGVFNHVGRDFFAFTDLLHQQQNSMFREWFKDIDFSRKSPLGDPFSYQGWQGHMELVKLNGAYSYVQEHLFSAIRMWKETFEIDGLRLDAADELHDEFILNLSHFAKELKEDFWLMGELIHGDYTKLLGPDKLDSLTNYECWKGLYSSHNDGNYFEIAHSLKRLFNPSDGLCRDVQLYNFADNHDVNRVASLLHDQRHLYPLHLLLFTMPGIPSIYYGSEWGIQGRRSSTSDAPLRPELELPELEKVPENGEVRDLYPHRDLAEAVSIFSQLREQLPALQIGKYKQVYVASQQFAFLRFLEQGGNAVLIAVNAEEKPAEITLDVFAISEICSAEQSNSGTQLESISLRDLLNPEFSPAQYNLKENTVSLIIPGNWGCMFEITC
ncbi:MAG: alpha-amylase [Spirochaetia bacterium]|nr:alpha-amylase [Spirochaetia bacterium]